MTAQNRTPLTIARLKRHSRVLGPGCRAVVWTHGCSKRCPNCIAREMNDAPPEFEHTASSLYEWLKNTEGIEGLTLSGGEPFEQNIETLEEFLRLVKSDPRRLSIMCYTGKMLDELRNDERNAGVLKYIDLLVDGPYVQKLNAGHCWRGSSNQQIHPLNNQYEKVVRDAENRFDRGIEIGLSAEMRFELTGIPEPGFMEHFERKLRENGYSLDRTIQ